MISTMDAKPRHAAYLKDLLAELKHDGFHSIRTDDFELEDTALDEVGETELIRRIMEIDDQVVITAKWNGKEVRLVLILCNDVWETLAGYTVSSSEEINQRLDGIARRLEENYS